MRSSPACLAIPPIQKKTEAAKHALDLLWADGEDSFNFFKELTIQKRIENSWYAGLKEECRYGRLSEKSYNFLSDYRLRILGRGEQTGR